MVVTVFKTFGQWHEFAVYLEVDVLFCVGKCVRAVCPEIDLKWTFSCPGMSRFTASLEPLEDKMCTLNVTHM